MLDVCVELGALDGWMCMVYIPKSGRMHGEGRRTLALHLRGGGAWKLGKMWNGCILYCIVG